MRPNRGVQPSKTVPKGSTAEKAPPANRTPGHKGKATTVDRSDRGVKGLRPTKDRGTKNLPVRRDLGDR